MSAFAAIIAISKTIPQKTEPGCSRYAGLVCARNAWYNKIGRTCCAGCMSSPAPYDLVIPSVLTGCLVAESMKAFVSAACQDSEYPRRCARFFYVNSKVDFSVAWHGALRPRPGITNSSKVCDHARRKIASDLYRYYTYSYGTTRLLLLGLY